MLLVLLLHMNHEKSTVVVAVVVVVFVVNQKSTVSDSLLCQGWTRERDDVGRQNDDEEEWFWYCMSRNSKLIAYGE